MSINQVQMRRRLPTALRSLAATLTILWIASPVITWTPLTWALVGISSIAIAMLLLSPDRRLIPSMVILACCCVSPFAWPSLWALLFTTGSRGLLSRIVWKTVCGWIAIAIFGFVTLPLLDEVSLLVAVEGVIIYLGFFALVCFPISGYFLWELREAASLREMFEYRQQDLSELKSHLVQSAERRILTRELHDMLGSHLALISMSAQTGLASDLPSHSRDVMSRVFTHTELAQKRLRSLVELRTSKRSEQPVESVDLDALFSEARQAGLRLELNVSPYTGHLSQPHKVALYLFFREGVTNILKYASPGVVDGSVILVRGNVIARLSSPNEGSTFPSTAGGAGTGLFSLRERAESLDGVLTWTSYGKRFDIEMRLPRS